MFRIHDIIGTLSTPVEIYDIGAMPEGRPRYAPLLEAGVASVTAFEPQEEQAAALENSQRSTKCIRVVLGDGCEHSFYQTRYPGCSSLLEPAPETIDAFVGIGCSPAEGNFHVTAVERVATVRLDALEGLPQPDLIKLDIQGAELLVLRHGTRAVSQSLVVECEVEFVPLYRQQPLLGDVQTFMRDQGFFLHRLENVQGRCFQPFPIDNPSSGVSQPLWCDAVFVRDVTNLLAWDPEELLLTATILHECYGSYDLTLRLLAAFDQRQTTSYARDYLRALISAGPVVATYPDQRSQR